MAEHYGAVVIPARSGRAKDKAKVETSVLVAQRWILATLRNHTFFSLAQLNTAIRDKLVVLNTRPMQRLGVSRQQQYEQLDRPALKPLPAARYELCEWSEAGVNIDYHVLVDRNLYSVPYQLVHERVEVRYSASCLEILFKGKRVASHARLRGRGQYSTRPEHMPAAHRAHAQWSPSRLIRWGQQTGPATGSLVAEILSALPHPEQGYRSCLGVMRLGKSYGEKRPEAACERAHHLGSCRYRTVKNIHLSRLRPGQQGMSLRAHGLLCPSGSAAPSACCCSRRWLLHTAAKATHQDRSDRDRRLVAHAIQQHRTP